MVKLFVEGGGDAAALKAACREGFTTFITKAGLSKRPRVVACGSRQNAQVMESWFLADVNILKDFFGQGFNSNALPVSSNIEQIAKTTLYDALKQATKDCKTKNQYGKGEHSFKLLGRIDPAKVIHASPWAARFVTLLKEKMNA